MNSSHLLTIGAVVVSALLIGGGVYLGSAEENVLGEDDLSPSATPTIVSQEPMFIDQEYAYPSPLPTGKVDIPIGDNPAMGSVDAPILMIEYTDYECPKCAEFHENYFDRLKEDYIDKGLMRFAVKDFPLSGHTRAQFAAEVSNCVYELGGTDVFYKFIAEVFKYQQEWVKEDNVLYSLAVYSEPLGVNTDALRSCFSEKRWVEEISADVAEGRSYGVNGTPIFFVNGTALVGTAPSYEELVAAIEAVK
jgi:protein-disulfide isomerase